MRPLLALLALTGCGPGVDFAGSYSGELAVQSSCSGSSVSRETWVLSASKDGTRLEQWLNGVAPQTLLQLNGSIATLPAGKFHVDTPPQDVEVVDGALTLAGKDLGVVVNVKVSPPAAGCSLRLTGTLTKP